MILFLFKFFLNSTSRQQRTFYRYVVLPLKITMLYSFGNKFDAAFT